MKHFLHATSFLRLLLLQCITPWISAYAQQNDSAIDTLETIRARTKVPGLVAMEVPLSGAEIVLVDGVRKYGAQPKIQIDDYFHLGSLTKAMTATLVAKLIEDGVMAWDTTIGEVLSDEYAINPAYQDVTVEQLGAQRTGFTDDSTLGNNTFFLSFQGYSEVEGRRVYLTQALQSQPVNDGTEFVYSNINYIVLGHMIDVLVGPWEDTIRARLFEPLDMTDCGFGPAPESGRTSIDNPWPHVIGNGSNAQPMPVPSDFDNPPMLGPAGTVHCKASSYARFLQFHLSTAITPRSSDFLSAETVARLHSPYDGPGETYTPGGWFWTESSEYGVILFHDGSNGVNYAYSYVVPDQEKAFFSFTNIGLPNGMEATLAVVDGLTSGTFELNSNRTFSGTSSAGPGVVEATGGGDQTRISLILTVLIGISHFVRTLL